MTSEGESAADAEICFGLNDGSIWQMEEIGKSCLVSLVQVVVGEGCTEEAEV